MGHLLFGSDDLLDELQTLRAMVGPFTAHESMYDLSELEGQLKGLIAAGPGGSTPPLEIPESRPWRTRISEGEFEPPHKSCNTKVYAEVTGIWSASIVLDGPKRPSKQKKRVAFTGVASTVIRVVEATSGDLVAMWKMELGDENAPGCYFHSHAGSAPGFPVPRHPNLFATPMAAVGFVLGELYQGAWAQAVEGAGPPDRWRYIQKRRMTAILQWALKEVEAATSSPWMALKAAKPPSGLFL